MFEMVRKKFAMISELRVELNNFRAVDLISSARSLAEKILWSLIAILGTVWIGFIVLYQMQYWDENPVLVTKGVKSLSGLHQPALTFCHRGMQKFGLVERMVGSVKNAVRVTLKARTLTFEELNNLFIQAEGLINNRPLCPVKRSDGEPLLGCVVTPAELTVNRTLEVQPIVNPKNARISDYSKYKRTRQLLHKQFWKRNRCTTF